MILFDHAIAIVCEVGRPVAIERVPIGEAHRHVLAEPVIARVDSPPSNVSAMDGYAVREEDLVRLPARLQISGQSFAGSGFIGDVEAGSCTRIFTGAPVPPNADRIIIQEAVRREGEVAVIESDPGPANYIRLRGSDFLVGDVLIKAGQCLNFRALVTAAGADLSQVAVWRRPTVSILATGDELAAPGSAADKPGSIPESVTFGVAAMAEDWGASVTERILLPDDLATMETAAGGALKCADLVVVTGGASVGDKDFAKSMFECHGLELLFSKVAMKPGKPVWLGRANGKLVMGLPGNPTSALVTARLLLAPLIAGLSGLDPRSALHWRKTPFSGSLPACGDRETFVRACAVEDRAEPLSNQESSAQKALSEANLLIRCPFGTTAAAVGEKVWVLDF